MIAGETHNTPLCFFEGFMDFLSHLIHGEDYAETAFQRKLRHEANKKKKRGRRM